MTKESLLKARQEAQRFTALANVLLKFTELSTSNYFECGTKLSGSVKRASMELTRALAEMRRP